MYVLGIFCHLLSRLFCYVDSRFEVSASEYCMCICVKMALQIHLQNYDERLMEVLEDYGELHQLVKAKHAKLLPLTADCPQQVRAALERAGRRAPAAARAATRSGHLSELALGDEALCLRSYPNRTGCSLGT